MWSRESVATAGWPYGIAYDVIPDGDRLLLPVTDQPIPWFLPELRLILNWSDELQQRFER
ncbi:MAG: hypothetical protein HKN71_06385 [Gemmatimonadetes bacterium]|nr:hypothetical protein [Gemmatimonadota bacterium]